MQILKRIKSIDFLNPKKQGQNLIEFCFVLPLLIFLTLGIFELAMFWQDLNSVYALNTEINANAALIDTTTMNYGQECEALTKAKAILAKKSSGSFSTETTGSAPFALYKYSSSDSVNGKPRTTLWVDCSNPFENGITTQIEFYHRNLIMKASIPRMDGGDPIVLIPENVFIASPKLNTIRHY